MAVYGFEIRSDFAGYGRRFVGDAGEVVVPGGGGGEGSVS